MSYDYYDRPYRTLWARRDLAPGAPYDGYPSQYHRDEAYSALQGEIMRMHMDDSMGGMDHFYDLDRRGWARDGVMADDYPMYEPGPYDHMGYYDWHDEHPNGFRINGMYDEYDMWGDNIMRGYGDPFALGEYDPSTVGRMRDWPYDPGEAARQLGVPNVYSGGSIQGRIYDWPITPADRYRDLYGGLML